MLFKVVLFFRTLERSTRKGTSSFRISWKTKTYFSTSQRRVFSRVKVNVKFSEISNSVRSATVSDPEAHVRTLLFFFLLRGPFASRVTSTNFINILMATTRCSLRVLVFESTNFRSHVSQ